MVHRSTRSRALSGIHTHLPSRKVFPTVMALSLLTMLALLFSGCGSSSATSGAVQASGKLTITAYDNYFDPKNINVPADAPITITFVNKGKVSHIVEIKGLISETTLQPGQSKSFTVTPLPRSYKLYDEVYVVSGMEGVFVGVASKNANSGTPVAVDELVRAGEAQYRAYLIQEGDALIAGTQQFTDAVIAGDVAKAKQLYAPARIHYESIEPIAEGLGDLDPRIDARDGDVPANQWTGFHRIEKALWVDNTTSGMTPLAQQLLADVRSVRTQLETVKLTPIDVLDGAVGLLDEASKSKITGEEDRYSHTDFYDLIGNVDGSRAAFEAYKRLLIQKDPDLTQTIDDRFTTLSTTLATYRRGDGYVSYGDLSASDTRTIAQQIDAVGEPLSRAAALMPQE